MIIDSRSLSDNTIVETDVCIVGAGVAGVTLAHEFIGQQFRVCLLESGNFEPDRETQSLYWGENVGYPYYTLDTARACFFGGSSNRWHVYIGENRFGARIRPLDTIDFEERGCIPHSGWPFNKSHLDPFYERAQSICKIGPFAYDAKDWEDPEKAPRLPFIGERIKTVIFQFVSRDVFITDYRNEVKCSDNVTAFLNAIVAEIETDEVAKTVTRLRVVCLQGKKFWVKAKLFILAIGGIETPRLLLLSNKTQSTGLGNQNDLVGRYFMEHLHFWSGMFIPYNQNIFYSTALYNEIHKVGGIPVVGKLTLDENVLRQEKLLNFCIQLIPRITLNNVPNIALKDTVAFKEHAKNTSIDFGKHTRNKINNFDKIALTTFTKVRMGFNKIFKKKIKVFRIAYMTEQVPNPDSRVLLAEGYDSLGLRRSQLDWRLSDRDILSVVRIQEIIDQELRRAGLGRLYNKMRGKTPPSDLHGGYHHMGTTRMHTDPKKGVVDENCKVHGISNLFIAGPSVFPTGGYANPVLTVVALSARLADHVKKLVT